MKKCYNIIKMNDISVFHKIGTIFFIKYIKVYFVFIELYNMKKTKRSLIDKVWKNESDEEEKNILK